MYNLSICVMKPQIHIVFRVRYYGQSRNAWLTEGVKKPLKTTMSGLSHGVLHRILH